MKTSTNPVAPLRNMSVRRAASTLCLVLPDRQGDALGQPRLRAST